MEMDCSQKKEDVMTDKYWYKTYIVECPVCGNTDEFKERVYTEKPLNIEERFDYKQQYYHCEN